MERMLDDRGWNDRGPAIAADLLAKNWWGPRHGALLVFLGFRLRGRRPEARDTTVRRAA